MCTRARCLFIPLLSVKQEIIPGLDLSVTYHALFTQLAWVERFTAALTYEAKLSYNEADQTSKVLKRGVRAWHHLHCLWLRLVRRLHRANEWYRILISVIVFGYQFLEQQRSWTYIYIGPWQRYWGLSGSVTAVFFSRRVLVFLRGSVDMFVFLMYVMVGVLDCVA